MTLTDAQVAAIVFNETRSLSGPAIDEAWVDISHAILNALASKHRFPKMAPSVAKVGPGESGAFASCRSAVLKTRENVKAGADPTSGSTPFNFRGTASQSALQGHALKTSSVPLDNSYPTKELPASGIYANTYE